MPSVTQYSAKQPIETMGNIETALIHCLHGKKANGSNSKALSDKSAGFKSTDPNSSNFNASEFKPDDSKPVTSKSSVHEFKSDGTPIDAKAASKMDVRVDLYIQKKDEDFKCCGHTLMGLQAEWGLPDLCDAIQSKFQGEQKLPLEERPNLPLETVWPETHKVKKIASVSKDAVPSAWDERSVDQIWLFNPLNCTSHLRAMEQNRAPQGLAVYITPQQDDYIY